MIRLRDSCVPILSGLVAGMVLSHWCSACGGATRPSTRPSTCPYPAVDHPSVAVLRTADGKPACTGWAWDDRHVATAAHCVAEIGTEHPATWRGSKLRVVASDATHDIALLEQAEAAEPFVGLRKSWTYDTPDTVVAGGCSFPHGVQSKPVDLEVWPNRRTLGCLCSGDSGAPALRGGTVVGILSGGHPGELFIIPLSDAFSAEH